MTTPSPGTSASPPAPSPPAPFPPRQAHRPRAADEPGADAGRESSRESRSLWDDPPPNLWDEEREHPTG